MKNPVLFLLLLLSIGCENTQKDIEYIICKDSIRYWNYEWKHKHSESFGFTFSFDTNGKVLKYSHRKESNTRKLFEDSHVPGFGSWKVTKDSVLTFMNSQYKITSYSKDTIHSIDKNTKENVNFIRVEESDLNIVKE